jgi:hypothetical protein
MCRRIFIISLTAALIVLSLGDVALACPTCKEGLAQADPEYAAVVRGYFFSILFMMSMPFLILGGMGTFFYLQFQSARRDAPDLVAQLEQAGVNRIREVDA